MQRNKIYNKYFYELNNLYKFKYYKKKKAKRKN